MGVPYFNRAGQRKQPPKSGYGFLEAVVTGVVSRAGALIEKIDKAHAKGGNPGFGAAAMLSATIMRYALGEPYANAFLNRLDSNDRLLEICGLPRAPSEAKFSVFKNEKLVKHRRLLQSTIVDVFLDCGVEIERLRAMGLVPTNKPMLGAAWVMDSTDVEAWARPGRKSRKTGEDIPSADKDAAWGHRTAKVSRSYKVMDASKRRSSKKGEGDADGKKDDKGEMFLGYSVNAIVDPNYGLPMFAETRPADASDMKVLIPGRRCLPGTVPDTEPRLFPRRQGLRQPEEHPVLGQAWVHPDHRHPAAGEGRGWPAASRRHLYS